MSRQQVINQSRQTIVNAAKQISHYKEKIEDINIGKFPKTNLGVYQEKVDKGIDKIISVRNSMTPLNQSIVAVMAGKLRQLQTA